MFDRSSSSRRGNTSDKAVFSSFLFLLAGEGRRGGEDGMGRRGEGGTGTCNEIVPARNFLL